MKRTTHDALRKKVKVMLAALKLAERELERLADPETDENPVLDEVRAAIAEAER